MTTIHRILLVEDDPAVAASLIDGVGREGYALHWEASGLAGLAHARSEPPHLVILDVRLPDISGFDVCRRMREESMRQPILMLTVQSDEVDKVLGLELGADDYLTKPYRLHELVARVRALLRRAYGDLASTESDVLYVADLVIDRTRGTVRRAGRDLGLTPLEMRLLVFFAQHPSRVFSRAQLIEQVWGMHAGLYDEKSVSVHVRRLREKIEDDPSDPRIVITVAGLGYRLDA